jgi:uncharacterized NAD(P)/FAD-binding protein YdhS
MSPALTLPPSSFRVDSGPPVLIVGGGASGVIAAIRLLGELEGGRVLLVERQGRLGRGVAYGSQDPHHLLNVRAGNMSAFPECPGDFVEWLEENGDDEGDVGRRFVPRIRFGQYLESRLERAIARSSSEFVSVMGEAVGVGVDLTVRLGSGDSVKVDHLVLALGNLAPSLPAPLVPLASDPRIVVNPWVAGALEGVDPNHVVLVVGTGLTMVDTVSSLSRNGHKGKIYARSRHGLVSQVHAPSLAVAAEVSSEKEMMRQVIDLLRNSGESWRGAVDALRPRTVELWQSLSWKQRGRFRRRLQVFWDVHRHRIPEALGEELAWIVARGGLDIASGRIVGVKSQGNRIGVRFSSNQGSEMLLVDSIVNCTGPCSDLKAARLPLVESLVEAGLAEYDPLEIGLLVDDDGETGHHSNVWALGPLCRGCRLETTAIPEIRVQAKRLSERISTRPRVHSGSR